MLSNWLEIYGLTMAFQHEFNMKFTNGKHSLSKDGIWEFLTWGKKILFAIANGADIPSQILANESPGGESLK